MTATDTDALTERIARVLEPHTWESHDEWVEPGHVNHALADAVVMVSLDNAAAVLPIVAEEVRKAKAEALREAAGPEWGNNNTLWSGPRVRAKITRRADRIETGGSDEHR